MVPQNYHFMEQLPTLSNGKINRKQLREDFKEETAVIRFSKATTETEEKLLDIWKQLFGYENIGIEDNYFSLGGDSLIAKVDLGSTENLRLQNNDQHDF